MNAIDSKRIHAIAAKLYSGAPALPRLLQTLRPSICPFEPLIAAVPPDSSVLDVGCGCGLFLLMLRDIDRIESGHGFDTSVSAIRVAREAAARHRGAADLAFDHVAPDAKWPGGEYDVVSMIDVLHHVPPVAQKAVVQNSAARLRVGGTFIYKDMVSRPRWRAAANVLHDLILARQLIVYRAIEEVKLWLIEAGCTVVETGCRNMLWYGHEWVIARKQDRDLPRS